MESPQPFPWRAEIGPVELDPDTKKTEVWVTKNREDRDSAIQATLRSFAIARQYLTETKFSSSARLIRFFEGVTASMSRSPSPDAFEFARRAFESVVRYGPNESMSTNSEEKESEDGEARLLTLQAFHNLGVVHHRRWLQLWEEQTGFDARSNCAARGEARAMVDDCKVLKAREMATLSYEAAHRYYECVIANSSREGEARGRHQGEMFFQPMALAALLREDTWASKAFETASAEMKALEDRAYGSAIPKPSKAELRFAQTKLEEARKEKDRSGRAVREMTSYRDSMFGRRLAVLLLASLGLLELIVQGRIRWKLSFRLEGAPVLTSRELNFDVLLRLSAELVKMAEKFECIPSVEGIEFSGIEKQLTNLYSATLFGEHLSLKEGLHQEDAVIPVTATEVRHVGSDEALRPDANAGAGKTSGDALSSNIDRGVSDAAQSRTGRPSWFKKFAFGTSRQEGTDTTTGFRDQAEPKITSAFQRELEKICIERKRLVERVGQDGRVKWEQLIVSGERISSRLRWTEGDGAERLDILNR